MLTVSTISNKAMGTSGRLVSHRQGASALRQRVCVPQALKRGVVQVRAFKEDDKKVDSPLQNITPRLGEAEKAISKSQPAYDQNAVQVLEAIPAFTRRREIFAGRLAMLGFVAAWYGEVLTSQGIIGQVQLWTGWSEQGALLLLGGIVAFNLISGLWPSGPTFSAENQEDVQKRPAGPIQEVLDPITAPKQWFGISGWGFSKANELFHGRLAMLGFAGAVLMELYKHQGVIAQVAKLDGLPVNYSVAGWGLATWAVAATAIAYLAGNPGELRGGKDIY